MKLYNTDFEEQETIVHIDYARSQIHLYSCRKTTIFSYDEIVKSSNNKGFLLQSIW